MLAVRSVLYLDLTQAMTYTVLQWHEATSGVREALFAYVVSHLVHGISCCAQVAGGHLLGEGQEHHNGYSAHVVGGYSLSGGTIQGI